MRSFLCSYILFQDQTQEFYIGELDLTIEYPKDMLSSSLILFTHSPLGQISAICSACAMYGLLSPLLVEVTEK